MPRIATKSILKKMVNTQPKKNLCRMTFERRWNIEKQYTKKYKTQYKSLKTIGKL